MCRRWAAICLQAYVPAYTEHKVFRMFRSKSTGSVLHLQSSSARHAENTARKLRYEHERKWELYQSAVVTKVGKTRTTLTHLGTPLQSAWPSHIATQGSCDPPSKSLYHGHYHLHPPDAKPQNRETTFESRKNEFFAYISEGHADLYEYEEATPTVPTPDNEFA